ncbi:PEP-CTERM sorting domain-containing protein [Akkermansiaceae bacterium]|nr:PEP-CTERM sorting domain-containing protein [Akkermansiaceae bacterium]
MNLEHAYNMNLLRKNTKHLALLVTIALVSSSSKLHAFSYTFADSASINDANSVTHATGYNGTGGVLNISVGVDSTSVNASDMLVSVGNAVNTFNNLIVTTGNLSSDFTNIASGAFDFESVLLHELGHSLGLGHVNAASESGLTGSDQNYTVAGEGDNSTLDLNAGSDGIIGSADDIRGDDVNFNWFSTLNNDPFAIGAVVDSTTYSVDIANLPSGDSFSANGDRLVAGGLGYTDTEAVMQQGTFNNEIQRTLAADDVAGILFANSGFDRIAGTADDYTINLSFVGLTSSADILIDFDNSTSFAVSQSSASIITTASGTRDAVIVSNNILFNDGFDWHFNTLSSVPEPSALVLSVFSCGFFLARRRS